jgi:hypothetical protein
MGAWSDDIFGNDLAADVRDAYRARLAAGDTGAGAVKRVRREFAEPMRDADDRRTVWIALAAAQALADAVSDEVRQQALKAIAWCEAADRDPDRFPSPPTRPDPRAAAEAAGPKNCRRNRRSRKCHRPRRRGRRRHLAVDGGEAVVYRQARRSRPRRRFGTRRAAV